MNNKETGSPATNVPNFMLETILLILLYLTSLYNYLLFHSMAEIFSIVIAGAIFIIGWHSKSCLGNSYLQYISIAYLFIAVMDLFHTLSYPGMNIFRDYDYYAQQMWIGARFFEAAVLVTGFFFVKRQKQLNIYALLFTFAGITALIMASVFVWKIFPVCYVEGEGLTRFKKNSEYIICLIMAAAAWLMHRNKTSFSRTVYRYMQYSILYIIIAELAFSFYISSYGISNLIGHYFKIFSFYCIYRAIIVTGIEEPQLTVFKELVDKENKLKEADRTKDNLFSILMHDMRGPVRTLHEFLHHLSTEYDSYSREDIKKIIDAGHKSVGGMNSLLENLYTWIRTQSHGLTPDIKPHNLLNLISEAVEPHRQAAAKKDISIDISMDRTATINTDTEIFKSVIRNLVNNAIKFTRKNGRIFISAENTEEEVRITVQDTGIGIPDDILQNIMGTDKKFTSKGTDNEQGSGIGLKICQDMLELINGTMLIESEVGKGTDITVLIYDRQN